MNVARADNVDHTIVALEAHGAVRFDPVEVPADPLARAAMHFQRRPDGMGTGHPGLRELRRLGGSPGGKELREFAGQERRERLRREYP